MKLPFKLLAIYSKEMDEKHKPKTIAEYIIHYFGNYQYATYYLNEEDFGKHLDSDKFYDKSYKGENYNHSSYDNSFHCKSSRYRSYSDLYSLIYTYFKRFFDREVSFEEFIFTITWLYKKNFTYLYFKRENPYNSNLYGFYCPDVKKYVLRKGSGRLCTNNKSYSLLNIYDNLSNSTLSRKIEYNLFLKKDNPILSSMHYFYRSYKLNINTIKEITNIEEAYKFDTDDDNENTYLLKTDNVTTKLLNDAHDLYYNKKNYKVIATYGSLKLGFHNHILLQKEGVINLGEFKLNIPYKMVDLGQFPGLIKDTKNNIIPMELYVVPIEVYKSIERLEGYPDFYDKQIVNYNDNVGVCELMVKDIEFYVLNEKNNDYSKYDLVENNKWNKIIK